MRSALVALVLSGCAPAAPPRPLHPSHPTRAPSLRLEVEDQMGSSFVFVSGDLQLDRLPVWSRRCDDPCQGPRVHEVVRDGAIEPGPHELVARFVYRNSSGFGVFEYIRAFRFTVDSHHAFEAERGRGRRVEVVAYERGGPTTPLEERPAVKFRERVVDL